MKNANRAQLFFFFQNSTGDRMTQFIISVSLKRRRDNKWILNSIVWGILITSYYKELIDTLTESLTLYNVCVIF